MSVRCEVWVIPPDQIVLITDDFGPPVQIHGYYASEEARRAAEECGQLHAFPRDCFLGGFDDWRGAYQAASEKAEELGYEIREKVAWDDDDWDRGV